MSKTPPYFARERRRIKTGKPIPEADRTSRRPKDTLNPASRHFLCKRSRLPRSYGPKRPTRVAKRAPLRFKNNSGPSFVNVKLWIPRKMVESDLDTGWLASLVLLVSNYTIWYTSNIASSLCQVSITSLSCRVIVEAARDALRPLLHRMLWRRPLSIQGAIVGESCFQFTRLLRGWLTR